MRDRKHLKDFSKEEAYVIVIFVKQVTIYLHKGKIPEKEEK